MGERKREKARNKSTHIPVAKYRRRQISPMTERVSPSLTRLSPMSMLSDGAAFSAVGGVIEETSDKERADALAAASTSEELMICPELFLMLIRGARDVVCKGAWLLQGFEGQVLGG